jgi:hypothetical protein
MVPNGSRNGLMNLPRRRGMIRYDFAQDMMSDCYCDIKKDEDGLYVLYEDANERIKELEGEIKDRAETESSLVLQLVKSHERIKELERVIKDAAVFFGGCMNDGTDPDPQEWFEIFIKALTEEVSDE